MFTIWAMDRIIGVPTTVTVFKDNEKDSINYFNQFYSKKYDFKNIVKCKNIKYDLKEN